MEIDTLRQVVICKEEDDIVEAAKILRDTRQRHLIVVNSEKEPLGIISTVDICNKAVCEEKNPKELKAKDIMTAPIKTADFNDSYEEAYEKMIGGDLLSIPVTNEGKLVGVLNFDRVFEKIKEVKEDERC